MEFLNESQRLPGPGRRDSEGEAERRGRYKTPLSFVCVCVCFISGTLHVKALNLYAVWADGCTQQMEHFLHTLVCVINSRCGEAGNRAFFFALINALPAAPTFLAWTLLFFPPPRRGRLGPLARYSAQHRGREWGGRCRWPCSLCLPASSFPGSTESSGDPPGTSKPLLMVDKRRAEAKSSRE